MGVDYVPTRKEIELYSINWPGHEFMGRSLDLLGADLTKRSGSNDGSFVPSAICREWARLLRTAVTEDRIRLATVKGVRGRERQVPVVDGAATRLGSLSADLESIDVAFGGDRFVPEHAHVSDGCHSKPAHRRFCRLSRRMRRVSPAVDCDRSGGLQLPDSITRRRPSGSPRLIRWIRRHGRAPRWP